MMHGNEQFDEGDFHSATISFSNFLIYLNNEDRLSFLDEYLTCLAKFYKKEGAYASNLQYIENAANHLIESNYRTQRLYTTILFNGKFHYEAVLECIKLVDLADTPEQKVQAGVALESAKSHLFDQWHWPMINDEVRNTKFAQGIVQLIEDVAKDPARPLHILDLGCGSGILSVIAAREVERIYKKETTVLLSAVDSNRAMTHIAERVFRYNKVKVALECVHSSMFDHDQQVNLIICELIDCAIFGERIVSSLVDIYDRVACRKMCVVLPRAATFYLALCESATIESQHFHETIGNFVLISHETYLNRLNYDSLPNPYDSMYLEQDPNGYRLLSTPQEVFTVDFTDLSMLRHILKAKFHKAVNLVANTAGRACAVVGLHLGNNIVLNSGPDSKSCWPQAIFPFYPPCRMETGQEFECDIIIVDERLYVRPLNLDPRIRTPLRASNPMPFAAMNNSKLRSFFDNFFEESIQSKQLDSDSLVLDATDLVIPAHSTINKFNYCSQRPLIRYVTPKSFETHSDKLPRNFAAILHWPFDSHGQLEYDRLVNLLYLTQRSKHNRRFPSLAPARIVLRGMLINSVELHRRATLVPSNQSDRVYCNVNLTPMASFSNRYFEEIEHTALTHEALTAPTTLSVLDFSTASTDMLKILQSEVKLTILPSAHLTQAHALMYWYELETSSGSTRFSLRDLPFAVNAFVFSAPITLAMSEFEMNVSFMAGQFHFEVPLFNEPPMFRLSTEDEESMMLDEYLYLGAQNVPIINLAES
ncbi:hypothetical protein M3Y96_00916500 [Aphelenchoides besseyi]|nr:hypothetical protein M3Y96_00916500 [Aphelenchoides besseyi]